MPPVQTTMTIAPTPVHGKRFEGHGAWTRTDFGAADQWAFTLRPQTIAELDQAIEAVRAKGKDLSTVAKGDFPLPSFRDEADALFGKLLDGHGFVVIRGLPIDRFSRDEAAMAYWGLGAHLGAPMVQNAHGDRLYAVRDEGYKMKADYGGRGVRFSKTTEDLRFHTDSAPTLAGSTPDLVGLLCLQTAKAGGETALISAKAVHNVLLDERPDDLALLYRAFHHDRTSELRPGEAPTLSAPVFRFDKDLTARYMRFYLDKGHETAESPLGPDVVGALDALDEVMSRPELQVTFDMQRGDIQLLNNRFILHSRTSFEDHPEPERRRHYVRLWLSLAG